MDLKTGGDLRYYLKKKLSFEEKDVAFYVACISSALRYIHSKNIIHRDIKPENIILDERGYPHLADFGVAYVCPDESGNMTCNLASGTKQYLAPEVFTRSHIHGPQADYWSLGVVAYELLFSRRPFEKHCPISFITYLEKAYQAKQSQKEKNFSQNSKQAALSIDSVTTSSEKSIDTTQEFYSPIRNKQSHSTNGNTFGTNQTNCLFPVIAEDSSTYHSTSAIPKILQSRSSCTNINRVSNESKVIAKYREAHQYDDNLQGPIRCSSPNNSAEKEMQSEDHWIVDRGELPVNLMVPIPIHTSWMGNVSPKCSSFLKGLFDVRPTYRLGCANIDELMQHPWLKENKVNNWTELENKSFQPFFKPGKRFLKDGFEQFSTQNEKMIDENIDDTFTDTSSDDDIPMLTQQSVLHQSYFKHFHYIAPMYGGLVRPASHIQNQNTINQSTKEYSTQSSSDSLPSLNTNINTPKKNLLNNSTELFKKTAKKVLSFTISGSSRSEKKVAPLKS